MKTIYLITITTLALLLSGCSGGSSTPEPVIDYQAQEVEVTTEPIKALGIGQSNMTVELLDEISEYFEDMTYVHEAVPGTPIQFWTNVEFTDRDYNLIIFQQGASDQIDDTTVAQYKSRFLQMLTNIREAGITAPIMIAQATYINGNIDAGILQAQTELIAENSDVYAGPFSDELGSDYRLPDDTHFTPSGKEALASMWATAIDETGLFQ